MTSLVQGAYNPVPPRHAPVVLVQQLVRNKLILVFESALSANTANNRRVLSGMRPTGALHLGNYHGALKNWTELQYQYECYFFVADIHALTTGYEDTRQLEDNVWEIVIDWLAAGLNPASRDDVHPVARSRAFRAAPAAVDDHAARLARARADYKDQQEHSRTRISRRTGSSAIRCCRAPTSCCTRPPIVPVGEDQVAHVEITREVARRFNHVYGREPDFEAKVEKAIKSLGSRNGTRYKELRRLYQEEGDEEAVAKARAMLEGNARLTLADRERLLGYLEGTGRSILVEPDVLLTATPKVPGLDGRKMSKSYGNTIGLREDPDSVAKKLKTMQTDPARVRRTDPSATPTNVRSGIFTRSTRTRRLRPGCNRAAAGRHRLPRLQEARVGCSGRRDHGDPRSARRNSRRIATWCAGSSRKAARKRVTWRGRRSKKCTRRWA